MILTGSQLPMDAPESDGPKNLSDALACAADGRLHGVYIVFDGLGDPRRERPENRHEENAHAFESVNAAPAGRLEKGRLFLNGEPKPPAGLPLTLNANVSPGRAPYEADAGRLPRPSGGRPRPWLSRRASGGLRPWRDTGPLTGACSPPSTLCQSRESRWP